MEAAPPGKIAPLSEAEEDFCKALAWHAQQVNLGFARAVQLFGHIVRGMVAHDVDRGQDAGAQANGYIACFLDGLGVEGHNVEVDVEVTDMGARH